MLASALLALLARPARVLDASTAVGDVVVRSRRVEGPPGTPPVVLVHGMVVSSRYWVPLLRELEGTAPTWAPDLPGFGRSGPLPDRPSVPVLAGWLLRWLDAAGLAPAVLVANSFGCQLAVEAAVRRPAAVRALVLNGPTTDPAARSPLDQSLRWLATAPRESALQLPVLVRDYLDAGPRRAVRMLAAVTEDRIEERLPHVRQRAVVVRGTGDRIVPAEWAEEVVRLLPAGRLVTVPGAAHTVNFTHPRELAGVVHEVLQEVAP